MSNGEKLTGPEMMLRSVMKAMGLNPTQLMADLNSVIGAMQGGLSQTVQALERIEKSQQRNTQLLEHLCRELKIPLPDTGEAANNVALSPPALEHHKEN